MSADRIKISGARIITPYRTIRNGCVIASGGKIEKVSDNDIEAADCLVINAGGKIVSPGFIDIHTHGGGGHDFMDATADAFLGAAKTHAEHGTTAMVPTTLTSTLEELKKTFEVYRTVKQSNENGAEFLGLHLEGPYFSPDQIGAQDPKYIKDPDPAEYLEILGCSDDIVRWSAAPELKGAMEFGRELRRRGILASIGHSNAICEQAAEAYENGYRHITHLYSAMSGVRRINAYRYAGVIESAYLIDGMTVEIIADGKHLPEALLKLIYKIKGPDKIALVTDSMRAAGVSGSESILGSLSNGQRVIIEDGVAKMPDRTAFAGSIATADRLVRTMVNVASVPLADAVEMMTATPAKIIGADKRKGILAEGMDADMVIFDDNINIAATIIKGKIVYCGSDINIRRRQGNDQGI